MEAVLATFILDSDEEECVDDNDTDSYVSGGEDLDDTSSTGSSGSDTIDEGYEDAAQGDYASSSGASSSVDMYAMHSYASGSATGSGYSINGSAAPGFPKNGIHSGYGGSMANAQLYQNHSSNAHPYRAGYSPSNVLASQPVGQQLYGADNQCNNGSGAQRMRQQQRLSQRPGLNNTESQYYDVQSVVPVMQLQQQQFRMHTPAASRRPAVPTGSRQHRDYHRQQQQYDDDAVSTGLERQDSMCSTYSSRSTRSASVAHNSMKRSNVIPYSGGTGLQDPLGVNRTGKDKPELALKQKKGKDTSSTRSRNLEKLRRSVSGRSFNSAHQPGRYHTHRSNVDDDNDEEDEDWEEHKDNGEWYRGVPRGMHQPYGAAGREETRAEREKRIERQWREKQKELKAKRESEKKKR